MRWSHSVWNGFWWLQTTARPETRDKIIDQLKKRKRQLEETKRTLRQFRLSLTLRLLADQRIDPDQWHDQFLDRTYRADPFDAIIHRAMESPTFRGWSEDLLSSHPIHENDRPMVDQYLRSQLNECSTDLFQGNTSKPIRAFV